MERAATPTNNIEEPVTPKVDFTPDTISNSNSKESNGKAEPSRRRWISSSYRSPTDLDESLVESRPYRHAHIIKRPRALQFYRHDNTTAEELRASKVDSNSSSNDANEAEERSADDIPKQLARIDLFVDLIWVGIIANLSDAFGEQAFKESGVSGGVAIAQFILLFLPIWRIWDSLRDYTTNYYLDDILQRFFLVWILVLAVVYGVNAPFAYSANDGPNSLTLLITVFLIAKGSFLVAQFVHAIFAPFLRRQFLFDLVSTVLISGLFVGAIWTPYPGKIVLLALGNVEQPIGLFMASPTGDRLLVSKGFKRKPDVERHVARYEGFFIIILGEGVFGLIDGSPSGLGLTAKTGTVLQAMILYYVLHWLYFNGDQSRKYVHAMRRTWWKPVLWRFFHLSLFGSLLILTASASYLIAYKDPATSIEARAETSDPLYSYYYALWSVSASLGITLLSMTSIALLNRPLDPPKTLCINSRLIRLAPRVPAIAVIVCLPLTGLIGNGWFGVVVIILYALFVFEGLAGMEKGWTLFERAEDSHAEMEREKTNNTTSTAGEPVRLDSNQS